MQILVLFILATVLLCVPDIFQAILTIMPSFDPSHVAQRSFIPPDATLFPISRSIPTPTFFERIAYKLTFWARDLLPKRFRPRIRRDPAEGPTAAEYEDWWRAMGYLAPNSRPIPIYTSAPLPQPPPQVYKPAHSPYRLNHPPNTPFPAPAFPPPPWAPYPTPQQHPTPQAMYSVPSGTLLSSHTPPLPYLPLVTLYPQHLQGNMHPFLDGQTAQYPLRFNLGSFDFNPKWIQPNGRAIRVPPDILEEPATLPIVDKLRIGATFMHYEFTVKIGSGKLTLRNVLVQIQMFFNALVPQQEMDSLSEEDRETVRIAWERRCARRPQVMEHEPVKWVDYMGGIVWFKGLVPDERRKLFIIQASQ